MSEQKEIEKNLKETTKFLEENRVELNAIVGRAEEDVMSLTEEDLKKMNFILSKEDLKGYNKDLDVRLNSFKSFIGKRAEIIAQDEKDEKKEKDRRANLAQEYDKIELKGRRSLSTKIKELNEKDSTDGEIRAVTDLAIIEAKLKREQELLAMIKDSHNQDARARVVASL